MHYDLDDYQVEAEMFAIYPEVATGSNSELSYLSLGLCGEAGEVAEKIKKKIRDGKFDRHETAKELGDVLWYVANMAAALDYSLADIAYDNIKKLTDRKQRNVIAGSGDNR